MPEAVTDARWFLVVGVVLVVVALGGSVLRRLPVTTAIVYLAIGVAIGPVGLGLVRLDPIDDAGIIELLAELAVIVSLFTAGLKLRDPIRDRRWRRPIRLATISMVLTVSLIALVGTTLLGLPLGAAVILGAVLAPTDPVLASDVQVEHPRDRDELRFSLTGEAGFNDGSAFPFVMLGLGLLGLHELGPAGARWLAVDVAWAVVGGLAIGAVLGTVVARVVLYLRRTHREAVGLDEFLCLGLIALAYGVALLLHTYAFLAVFAAALAVRSIERVTTQEADEADEAILEAVEAPGGDASSLAADAVRGPAHLASQLLGFNERLERIGEVAVVVLLGALLASVPFPTAGWWFVPLLFLVIRPLAVLVGLAGDRSSRPLLALTAWFGIRGIGSVYYLAYAIVHGLAVDAEAVASLVLWTIAASIVVHGVSVTPLMGRYETWRRTRAARRAREGVGEGGATAT
ncbi:MAG TPA: cation:proton antiporter [Candidatus Limnocylindrales bacterium]|nr:cation:proton antiporter [Candidatus Limnocylindrales bacterium]